MLFDIHRWSPNPTYPLPFTHHSVLLFKHRRPIGVSLKQGLTQSKRPCNSVGYNGLKLHVISNKGHLLRFRVGDRNDGFRFQAHGALVDNALNCVVTCFFHSFTAGHRAGTEHNLMVLSFIHASNGPRFSFLYHL